MCHWDGEDELVDGHGEGPAGERPDPVDPVVGPVSGGQRRPEGPRGVHGRAGERSAGDGVGADEEAGEQRAEPWRGALGVEDGGVDGEEQREGEDDLRHHALDRAHARRQRVHRSDLQRDTTSRAQIVNNITYCCGSALRLSGMHVTGRRIDATYQTAGEGPEQDAGEGGAEHLGEHEEGGAEEGDVAADGEAQRDGRVHLGAGDVEPGRREHRHHQRMAQRHRDQRRRRVASGCDCLS